jgi:MFS family permease
MTTGVAATAEQWVIAEISYVVVLLVLLEFAVRRFLGRASDRRPPAAFVLIPFAFLHGLAGAGFILAGAAFDAPPWTVALGRLLVEQGVFLCLVVGIGGLVLPLMAGAPPPPDLGSSPRERRKAVAYGVAGTTILASLLLEQAGWATLGPLVRAGVVAIGLGLGGGAWRLPALPGLHRRLVWLAVWLTPLGLASAGIWPDYRVPALHVLFIGGFSLLAFGVATHVALSHLNLEHERERSPIAVQILGAGIILAMLGRVAADWSATYFEHLGAAAAAWLIGSAAWLLYLGPRLVADDR